MQEQLEANEERRVLHREKGEWLSRDMAALESDIAGTQTEPVDFDVLIVGSGYGGSIAAHELVQYTRKGKSLRIGMLERGKEYVQGMFPATFAELPGHVRFDSDRVKRSIGNRDGLFDIRVSDDIAVVQSNGLGGGSLINAGVMAVPEPSVFQNGWPDDIKWDDNLRKFYDETKNLVGTQLPATKGKPVSNNDVSLSRDGIPKKTAFFNSIATATPTNTFTYAPITISMEKDGGENGTGGSSTVAYPACKMCGDCATGCNHGAKKSLDNQLLTKLHGRQELTIYSGVTVLRFERAGDDVWNVYTTYTNDTQNKRHERPTVVRTRFLVLAAGTLGSTGLLLQSQSAGLRFSHRLGKRFSGNGDALIVGYGHNREVNSTADEASIPEQRGVGPSITGILDIAGKDGSPRMAIEELAVPGPLKRIFEEIFTTADLTQRLAEADNSLHVDGPLACDPLAVNPTAIKNTSVFAVMGDDGANGEMHLATHDTLNEPIVSICWPDLREHPLFDAQLQQLRQLAESAQIGGRMLANPLWQLLPQSLMPLIGGRRGIPLTVHPLGGCSMGNNADTGVVNQYGQVFNTVDVGPKLHKGLAVLDGSIVPTALGINPALTISALSLRAIRGFAKDWELEEGQKLSIPQSIKRPFYRDVSQPKPPAATKAEFIERLTGNVILEDINGKRVTKTVEITLYYQPKVISRLFSAYSTHHKKTMRIIYNPEKKGLPHSISKLRIFDPKVYEGANKTYLDGPQLETELTQNAEFEFAIKGSLTIMPRAQSTPMSRKLKGAYAWFLNRGARDTWQYVEDKIRGTKQKSISRVSPRDVMNLASRAGERRLFQYELEILEPIDKEKSNATTDLHSDFFTGESLTGIKTITYARRSNPLIQLTELELVQFPRLMQQAPRPLIQRLKHGCDDKKNILKLSPDFLVRKNLPLLRIVEQQDEPSALLDFTSLAMYFLRLSLSIHLWAFRKPDQMPAKTIDRLAGIVPGLPAPEIKWLPVGPLKADGNRDEIRLVRYARTNSPYPPVLLIHGYSASSTTFAHEALEPGLAKYLWDRDHNVWLADLRTSSGLATAVQPWTFDEIAENDIPVVIEYVYQRAGFKPIDIVAHCVGAAVFSMAVLGQKKEADNILKQAYEAQDRLPSMIRCAVLSQLAPAVVFSASNTLRTYILGYLLPYFDLSDYEFQIKPNASIASQLFDRLLAVLPYPESEFDIENPRKPWRKEPFAGTRHRMDALYGRTFSLANVSRNVLDNIDDFFGPLSIDTLSQIIYFSKTNVVTDKTGKNRYLSRDNAEKRWPFKTLHIHGEENGLADVLTSYLLRDIFSKNENFHRKIFPGTGHQDSLIGKNSHEVFAEISSFLSESISIDETKDSDNPIFDYVVSLPQCGPIFEHPEIDQPSGGPARTYLPIRFGAPASEGIPEYIVACSFPRDARGNLVINKISRQNIAVFSPNRPCPDTWFKEKLFLDSFPTQPVDNICLFLLYPDLNGTKRSKFNIWSPMTHQGKEESNEGPKEPSENSTFQQIEASNQINAGAFEVIIDNINMAIAKFKRPDNVLLIESSLIDLKLCMASSSHSNRVTFALGSCQYPAGILYPTLAYRSFDRLASRLRDDGVKPSFAIFTGDQVYVDATAGVFDPKNEYEIYAKKYEDLYANDTVRQVLRQLPSYTMLDDHEIDNDWQQINSSNDAEQKIKRKRNQDLRYHGVNAYLKYQRGPSRIYNIETYPGEDKIFIWYKFGVNDVNFFISDTRTGRQQRSATTNNWKIMLQEQFEALKNYLHEAKDQPVFIASPAIFLPRHHEAIGTAIYSSLNSDSWDGYPSSQTELLQYIVDHEIKNVVFLSGDEHISCVAKACIKRPDGKNVTIYSIHGSALHAPFPFANSKKSDLLLEDHFSWDSSASGKYSCTVDTVFAEDGNGFAQLDLTQNEESGRWTLQCEFMRDSFNSRRQYTDFNAIEDKFNANFISMEL